MEKQETVERRQQNIVLWMNSFYEKFLEQRNHFISYVPFLIMNVYTMHAERNSQLHTNRPTTDSGTTQSCTKNTCPSFRS